MYFYFLAVHAEWQLIVRGDATRRIGPCTNFNAKASMLKMQRSFLPLESNHRTIVRNTALNDSGKLHNVFHDVPMVASQHVGMCAWSLRRSIDHVYR